MQNNESQELPEKDMDSTEGGSETILKSVDDTENKRDDIAIIYFVKKETQKSIKRTNLFRNINDLVILYTDIDACMTYIENMKKQKIILLATGKSFQTISSRIENIRQIDGIFIFSSKLDRYNYSNDKITGIFSGEDEMVNALTKHLRIIQEQIQVFSYYRHHQRYVRNLAEAATSFLWFHIFKEALLRLPHDDDAKKDLLVASRHYYRNNNQELKRIDDFERIYESKNAVQWYTKNSFLYRLLNKALRTEDVDQMYKFRYFIQDLCQALIDKHSSFREYGEPVTVYRGLRLSQSEFEELTKSQDQLMSMNGYLSSTLTRRVAEVYAGVPKSTSDKISVLLEIECDVPQLGETVVFADIGSESIFPDENEVLFDIGATFKLASTPKQLDNGIWYIKMTATDEGRSLVRKYIDDYLKWNSDDSPRMKYGDLLYSLGKYDSCLSYFNQLLLQPKDENIILIHLHIANVLDIQGDRQNEWKHYETAYKLITEAKEKRPYDEGLILLQMGIFCSDSNHIDRALEYLKRFVHLYEQYPEDVSPEVSRALLIMAGCYEHQENFEQALCCYQEALQIHEEDPDSNHVVQCKTLIAIGNHYRLQSNYEDALIHFQQALEIRERTLPKQHTEIADCLSFIGKTLGDLDRQGEALIYSMRALEMYSKTLPTGQLNERSSVLVDIGLCFSNVDAFRLALKYFDLALEMKKKSLNHDHPDFAVIYQHMALCYTFTNRHLLALKYAHKAFRTYKRIHSPKQQFISESLRTLATVYSNMGCQNRAMNYLEKARKMLHRSKMHRHPKLVGEKRTIAQLERVIMRRKSKQPRRRLWSLKDIKRSDYINYLSVFSDIYLRLCYLN